MQVTTTLSPDQAKFALWVSEQMPDLVHLFDWDERSFIPDKVDTYLDTASHGEALMARFVLGVWRGQNQFDFDLIKAAKVLDTASLGVITNWLNEPFWP